MCGFQMNRVLAGTALALVLVLPGAAWAASDAPAATPSNAEIEKRIPLPEAANVPPPTAADFGIVTGATPATGSASIDAKIPMPPSADMPPPSAKDVGASPASAGTAVTGVKEPAPLATNLAAADLPVAEKLRDIVCGKLDRVIDRKKDRQAVEAFYTAHGFAPLWVKDASLSTRGRAVIARLKAADLDGRDPRDYAAPDFAAAKDADALAQAELKLTNAVLTY